MLKIPTRKTLVVQVAEILQKAIASGEWTDYLPGERRLCEMLQVSRSTLHATMLLLKRQGVVETSHGKQTWIVPKGKRLAHRAHSKIVAALFTESLDALSPVWLMQILELQRHLQTAGFEFRPLFDPRFLWRGFRRRMEKLVQQSKAECWVLLGLNRKLQKWFMDHRVPSIIVGTAHEGIRLPSISIHGEEIGYHAAGKFRGLGHRNVAFLASDACFARDLAFGRGFLQGFKTHGVSDVTNRVIHHNGTVEGVKNSLVLLLQSKALPTGILVSNPIHALTVVGYLLEMGRKVPREISVICTDYDLMLAHAVPSIAGYDFDHASHTRRMVRLIVELAKTGFLPARRPIWVISRFCDGGSLGPCPR